MEIYHYDQSTGIFWGDIEEGAGITEAKQDPLVPDSFLCPAYATFTPVPKKESGKVRAWVNDGWMYFSDYVNNPVYLKATGEKVPGGYWASLPDELTDKTPPEKYPLWNGEGWSENVSQCLADIIAKLELLCDEYQSSVFVWNGNNITADKAALNDISSTILRALSMKDTSPIPTNGGQWKTNDVDTWIYLTVAELKQVAAGIYDRNSALWRVKDQHKTALSKMKNVESMIAYDYTKGWDV